MKQRPCTRLGDRHFIYIISLILYHGLVKQPQKDTQGRQCQIVKPRIIHSSTQQIIHWIPMTCLPMFWYLLKSASMECPEWGLEPTEPLGCDRPHPLLQGPRWITSFSLGAKLTALGSTE